MEDEPATVGGETHVKLGRIWVVEKHIGLGRSPDNDRPAHSEVETGLRLRPHEHHLGTGATAGAGLEPAQMPGDGFGDLPHEHKEERNKDKLEGRENRNGHIYTSRNVKDDEPKATTDPSASSEAPSIAVPSTLVPLAERKSSTK